MNIFSFNKKAFSSLLNNVPERRQLLALVSWYVDARAGVCHCLAIPLMVSGWLLHLQQQNLHSR